MTSSIPLHYYSKSRLNKSALANAIGVSPLTIWRWESKGMPYHGNDRNKYYLLTEVMEWMQEQPKLFELWVELKMKLDKD